MIDLDKEISFNGVSKKTALTILQTLTISLGSWFIVEGIREYILKIFGDFGRPFLMLIGTILIMSYFLFLD